MVSTRRKNYERSPPPRPPPRPNSAEPSKDGVCRFLHKLPAEVRNQIYDLTLGELDGIYARKKGKQIMLCVSETTKSNYLGKDPPPNPDAVITPPWEINQLQYTCKQLRSETKGYALRVNDITFLGGNSPGQSAMGDCQDFLSRLASKWLSHLRRVNIRHIDPVLQGSANYKAEQHIIAYNFKIEELLMDICRANPQMTIHWGCPSWYLRETFCSFLLRGIFLTYAYRGINRQDLIAHQGSLDEHVEYWTRGKTTEELNVPNFRIHPWNFSKKKDFEAALSHAEDWCLHHAPNDVTMDDWKSISWQWYNDGI